MIVSTDNKIPFLYDMNNDELINLDGEMLFGRHASCDVTLRDDLVSSQHFKLSVRGNRVFVVDLESSNKTVVNDHELEPNVKNVLHNGDKLTVGSQKYTYFFGNQTTFKAPENTKTHSLQVKNESTESEIFFDDMFSFQTEKVEKKDYIKLLKESRQTALELEEKLKSIQAEIVKLEETEKNEIILAKEVNDLKVNLAKYNFNSNEDFEKEKSDYTFSQNEITKSVEKVEEIIRAQQEDLNRYNSQLKKVKESLEFITDLQGKYNTKTQLETKLVDTREEIEVTKGLDLGSQEKAHVKKLKDEQAKYKHLQECYGSDIKSKKRPPSNKSIKLGKS